MPRSRATSERGAGLRALALLAAAAASCHPVPRGPREERGEPPRGEFYTTVYMTAEEALRTALPDATQVRRRSVRLSDEEHAAVEELLGRRVHEKGFTVYFGLDGSGGLEGFAVIQEEIGKFKLITFIVGVEPDRSVRRVAVLVYREARGGEVAARRYLVQYEAKTVRDPFSINRDIINISGATMSVNAMNFGVRKVLAVLEVLYGASPARLREAIDAGEAIEALPAGAERRDATATHARHRDARLVMGSVCEIDLHGVDRARLRAASARAFAEIERVDWLLSDYRADSELSRVSRHGAGEAVCVSPLTADFLARGRDLAIASRGAFDLTVGPLVDAWGFRGAVPRRPEPAALAALAELVGYEKVECRQDAGGEWRVRLQRPGMRLDPGALGKGYAVDRAVAVLREAGVAGAMVNFSGCMYAMGRPAAAAAAGTAGAAAWPVAVRDPARPGRVLGTVWLRDRAIASSGGYEKFVDVRGERLTHILSPHTLAPVRGVLGAVVTAGDATAADGWSTAAAVLGAQALPLLEQAVTLAGSVVVEGGDGPVYLATDNWELN